MLGIALAFNRAMRWETSDLQSCWPVSLGGFSSSSLVENDKKRYYLRLETVVTKGLVVVLLIISDSP